MKIGPTKKKSAGNSFSKSVKNNSKLKTALQTSKSSSAHKLFPIVAIGASAGGLEAYTKILKNIRTNTGMAFVIIQHMSPDYKSMLKDILKRETEMEVITIKNKLKPEPDKVYIAPPTSSVIIKEGVFYLKQRGKNLKVFKPINIFMKSLAEDNKHFSIGIILSGSDDDGLIGMEYIKTGGGITYAQDSKTSKFFDMPKSSINAGVVDYILSPEAISRELSRISSNVLNHIDEFHRINDSNTVEVDELSNIFSILKANKNIDFRHYKPTTVKRRILRRLIMHKIKDIEEYGKFLNGNPAEINALCSDILINVTRFFRDPEMYESLKKIVFPKLFRKRNAKDPVRIWVSACSSGEEAYSMAIAVVEYLGSRFSKFHIQIFSTDLNEAGIEKARRGIYPENIKEYVSETRLRKFFIKQDSKYHVNKNIRSLCVFAKQNLIQDPPFSKMDMITCRNVLIYLGTVLQNKVLPIFHYALKDKGYLILGTSETVGPWKHLFEIADRKNRIFSKNLLTDKSIYNNGMDEIIPPNPELQKYTALSGLEITSEFENEIDRMMMRKYYPAGVLIDKNMEVLHFTGNTEPYLERRDGKSSHNLLKMCRQEICEDLKFIVSETIRKNRSARKNNVKLFTQNEWTNINIIAEPVLYNFTGKKTYLILFEKRPKINEAEPAVDFASQKVSPNEKKNTRFEFDRISKELAVSKTNLQSSVEQHETTDEELRSANEEIQTSNEELQSTNEELETIKEELQSTNEELTTVNEELQRRNIQLSNVNGDLTNILSSIKFSILMVDDQMKIKRFTKEATRLLNIIPSDIGRNITDINPKVKISNLKGLILEVLDKAESKEMQVSDDEGSIYSMRISPYKTIDKKIEGVIITFFDISQIRKGLLIQESLQRETDKLTRTLVKQEQSRTAELERINSDLQSQVTDRKNAESSLRRMSKNLIDVQEIERLKLSRELHDNVNQLLSVAKLKIHNIEESLKKKVNNKANVTQISDVKSNIIHAIEEIRRLSKVLRPSSLDDIGLNAALRSIIEDFRSRTGIRVSFKSSQIKNRLPEDTELSLYRIVQESLHNIEKHSGAENVRMSLGQKSNQIHLVISDNGRGFLQSKLNQNALKKFGLMGIKERAESVEGKFYIKSEPGLGTRIEVKIPLHFKIKIEAIKKNKNPAGR